MATMVNPRIEAGTGLLGNIFVYPIVAHANDDDMETVFTYEVRMGNHTVAVKDSEEEAMEVARVLQTEPEVGQDVRLSDEFQAYVDARKAQTPGAKRGR